MCRIAGIIDRNLKSHQLTIATKAMCDTMAHGGPDDEGYYQNDELGMALGHRRLSLIDLSAAGHQPMAYQQNQFIISFNGEIYNYLELKEELIAVGLTFQTHSDTEVILAAYAHWGTDAFNKLKGMFAFALYDSRNSATFLVRDPAGIKPLYYANHEQRLTFASEVKAFEKSGYPFSTSTDWKIYFLAFGHIPEPYTTLSNVLMLPKSHYLKWDHAQSTAEIKSFVAETKNRTTKIDDKLLAQNRIDTALKLAVKRHLIADAPIGVFLSGGIDSSLLTLLADEVINGQPSKPIDKALLNTVSINFENPSFSEKIYQDEVLTKVQAKHALYTVSEDDFNQHFPTALAAMDQPTADGINSWFVNYYAKQNGLKAVLSGIGADELFGGYPSFKRMGIVNQLVKLPKFILKSALNLKKQTLKRFYYLSYKNTVGKYLFLRGFFTPDEIASCLDISVQQVDTALKNLDVPILPSNLKSAEQASWFELNFYMQNQLLKDTDSMSMQHGIEVRVPFLDQDLIDLVHSIDSDIKYQTNQPKGLLIDSFIQLLPRKIWDRPKMGFTFPFQYWLQENHFFLSGMDLSKNKKAATLINEFKAGTLHWSKALALYQVFKK